MLDLPAVPVRSLEGLPPRRARMSAPAPPLGSDLVAGLKRLKLAKVLVQLPSGGCGEKDRQGCGEHDRAEVGPGVRRSSTPAALVAVCSRTASRLPLVPSQNQV